MKPARAGRIGGHGVSRVEDQVEHELLELHAIARNRRQIGSQFTDHGDAPPDEVGLDEVQHLLDDLVERERLQGHLAALEHGAQPLDDLARAAVRRHDVREDGLHLGNIRAVPEQAVPARPGRC